MRSTTGFAVAAALGTSLLAGAAHGQEMQREFDSVMSGRAQEGDTVRMRLSLPFGQAEADHRETRLSFGFQRSDADGSVRGLDVFSLSLAGDTPRLETPLALGAAGDEGFFSKPMNWVWVALGAGALYWIYEENQDDDDPAPVNNNN
jgi:hypothetical protein